MRLVGEESQHDQIGIQTVNAMPGVRVEVRLGLLGPNEIHDLVLSLSRNLDGWENWIGCSAKKKK